MATLQEDLATQICSNPKFREDIGYLLQYHFAKFSGNGDDSAIRLENTLVKRLAESTLILASSPNEMHKIVSYELATLLFEDMASDFPGLNGVMKLVCTRLENTPAVGLIDESAAVLPISLEVESEVAIVASTRSVGKSALRLTRFQMNAFELLSRGFTVSLSAPTSAGKSFLITQFVTNTFLESEHFTAVVIVPTRALIRQLTMDFHDIFQEHGLNTNGSNQIELLTSSVEGIGKESAPRMLFILTQERLQSVLYNWKQIPSFDLLIVDESQKIGDTKRGIILEDTIMEMASTHPRIQCVFLSPLSSNPGLLLEITGFVSDTQAVHSSFSPVAQHLYSVTTKKGNRRELIIEKLNSQIGEFTVTVHIGSSLPTSKTKRLAFLSTVLGRGSSNILYASGPAQAEKTALALAGSDQLSLSDVPDVLETVDYLSKVIHEDYYLVDCLKKGVAYHYGSMPEVARISVEDLFRNELIHYVACTSTLLEGVNLPAKNIFIEKPKLGREPMDDGSFWNLAGRAGRLMKDFSGNVFCVNPETWDRPVSERRRQYAIQSSLNRILNSEQFLRYCEEPSPEIDTESCEQALNTLVLKFQEKGEQATRAFIEQRAALQADTVMLGIASIAGSLSLPLEVLKKNKAIDVRLQNAFAAWLADLSYPDLLRHIPLQPFCDEYYETLQRIFQTSDHFFILRNRGERYIYFTLIAYRWTREASLRDMIISNLEYNKERGKEVDVNKVIRGLISALNDEVRYHYVRNTKCFCDILQFELQRRHISENKYPPYTDFWLPNYLELGMSNTGSIQLHNLGLSRAASIEVSKFCRIRGVEPENIVDWVRKRSSEIAQRMPRPLRSEILKVFSRL